jgi:hypothetical protein
MRKQERKAASQQGGTKDEIRRQVQALSSLSSSPCLLLPNAFFDFDPNRQTEHFRKDFPPYLDFAKREAIFIDSTYKSSTSLC